MASAVQIAATHILAQLHRDTTAPLFVAIQGPQGCGKTYLASHVAQFLESPPHSLSVAVLSIDDLYFPHNKLIALAETHPKNAFLSGRGLPGTHDLELGKKILQQLRHINESTADGVPREVTLPIFDKSLHSGAGDRAKGGVVKRASLDVVIMEGWCVGFCPITLEEIDNKWTEPVKGLDGIFSMSRYRKEDIVEINENLKDYVDLWHYFRVFIQIQPVPSTPYSLIYKWRLQQEHDMKARNGGIGATDFEVQNFVDRYIPGYVFFGDGVRQGTKNADGTYESPSWIGNGLAITIGEERNVVDVANF